MRYTSNREPRRLTMDASLRGLLDHRVGQRRADELLADLADDVDFSRCRMAHAMGGLAEMDDAGAISMRIPVCNGATWTGRCLELTLEMPDILLSTLPGRRLGEVIGHPALPLDRRITKIEEGEGVVLVECEADARPVASFVRRRATAISQWARRRQQRLLPLPTTTPHVAGFPVLGMLAYAVVALVYAAMRQWASDHAIGVTMGALGIAVFCHGGADGRNDRSDADEERRWMMRMEGAGTALRRAMEREPTKAL